MPIEQERKDAFERFHQYNPRFCELKVSEEEFKAARAKNPRSHPALYMSEWGGLISLPYLFNDGIQILAAPAGTLGNEWVATLPRSLTSLTIFNDSFVTDDAVTYIGNMVN